MSRISGCAKTVVADGLYWAVLHRFVALLEFFLVVRLLVADVMVFVVAHAEVVRSGIRADTAQNALRIDIKRYFFSVDFGGAANIVR